MVIDYLNLVNTVTMPFKTDSPLAVDSYRVLPGAAPAKRLQVIRRGEAEVGQRLCKIEHGQFPSGQTLDALRQLLRKAALKNFSGLVAFEGPDH